MSGMQLPGDQHRMMVIGKTGSGKTQGGLWQLSQRSIGSRPWIIFNMKREPLIDAIPKAETLRLGDRIPKSPGIYIVHPGPDDTAAVDAMLWKIWERGRIGVFVDEGYMIPARSSPYQALLTQGRSKSIPVITLTQRPTWISRFAFSEADFVQLYKLTDERDLETVHRFMPMPIFNQLPGPYYSFWWDNTRDYKAILQPVPDRDTILNAIYDRLRKPRRFY